MSKLDRFLHAAILRKLEHDPYYAKVASDLTSQGKTLIELLPAPSWTSSFPLRPYPAKANTKPWTLSDCKDNKSTIYQSSTHSTVQCALANFECCYITC